MKYAIGKHPNSRGNRQQRIINNKMVCCTCKKLLNISNFQQRAKTLTGFLGKCRDCCSKYNANFRETHRESLKKYYKDWYKNVKLEVFGHYSNKCVCCGENIIEFLCIDHMEGNGNKHRRELNESSIYSWLKRNNYPKGFQVLCYNCNMAKGFFGECPHKKFSNNKIEE